jgi:hypothetical protein
MGVLMNLTRFNETLQHMVHAFARAQAHPGKSPKKYDSLIFDIQKIAYADLSQGIPRHDILIDLAHRLIAHLRQDRDMED